MVKGGRGVNKGVNWNLATQCLSSWVNFMSGEVLASECDSISLAEMHGSSSVPWREPIKWKPWECSEPYVSMPACYRPNVGRGFTFGTHMRTNTSWCTEGIFIFYTH